MLSKTEPAFTCNKIDQTPAISKGQIFVRPFRVDKIDGGSVLVTGKSTSKFNNSYKTCQGGLLTNPKANIVSSTIHTKKY
jgi:hypothetical protein